MTNTLETLAERIETYAQDAKKPEPYNSSFPELRGLSRAQPPSIIALADGLLDIAAALRAIANQQKDSGE